MNYSKLQQRFTLIEFLAVFAVIAIMVTLLQPSLRRMRHHAYSIQCIKNLKTIAYATHNYLQDNNNTYIRETYNYDGRRYYNNNEFAIEQYGNYQVTYDSVYLENKEVFNCPSSHRLGPWQQKWTDADVFSYDYAMNSVLYSKNLNAISFPNQVMTNTDSNYEFIHWGVGFRVDVRHDQDLVHAWADGHVDKRHYTEFYNNYQWITMGKTQVAWSTEFTLRD